MCEVNVNHIKFACISGNLCDIKVWNLFSTYAVIPRLTLICLALFRFSAQNYGILEKLVEFAKTDLEVVKVEDVEEIV